MKKSIALLGLSLVLLGSCSKLTKVMKSGDTNLKYEAALQYYNDEDYYRAGLIFEDLIPNMIGKAEAEQVQFYYAYCHYYQSQYDLAAHYFKSFHDTYQRSSYAVEALYMHAYSLYKATPEFNLDQSNTNTAIEATQDFINRYPTSEYVGQAEDLIEELRDNLEMKAYNIGKQYHKLRRYKAAVIAYDNFQKDFPDSDFKEEVSFLKIQAEFEMAQISIISKQRERYQEVLDYYYYFIDKFPESTYLTDAEKIYAESQKAIATLPVRSALNDSEQ